MKLSGETEKGEFMEMLLRGSSASMRIVLLGVLGGALCLTQSVSGMSEPVLRGHAVRDGIGNVVAKLRAGGPVVVAYLGGSITAQGDNATGRGGWRVKTTRWLRETYPQSAITEVDGAIGGTGSSLGVFRVGQDVLSRNPDLLFVEFACNDLKTPSADVVRNMEGIVRQTWRHNPSTDIVFAYVTTCAMTNDYHNGRLPHTVASDERVAGHYGIPSVNFGVPVARLYDMGRLRYRANDIETAVPKDDPQHDRKVREGLSGFDGILFSNDGVHPRDEGHDIYFSAVTSLFASASIRGPFDHAARLAEIPLDADNLENAKIVPVTSEMLEGDWRPFTREDAQRSKGSYDYARFASRLGTDIWTATRPGSKLRFSFRGTTCKIYDIVGLDSGIVRVTVDGAILNRGVPRFDKYGTYYRLASLTVCEGLPNGLHQVELEILPEEPDRSSISFRARNWKELLQSADYKGTRWIVGKIMLVGDVVPQLGVNPYDYVVFEPKMPRDYRACDPSKVGDRYNDHFQVIYDERRQQYFAFWTQASKEGDDDMHIAFSKSSDLKDGWSDPKVLAGCARRTDRMPMAYWHQPMLSRKGRLYCLWNQQVGTNRCHYGVMCGRFSDDAGETWSEPETVVWPTNVFRNAQRPAAPPNWCIWQRPLRLGPAGAFLSAVTHKASRVGFIAYQNIDSDPSVCDISTAFYHATEKTYLRVPKRFGRSSCEEASIVRLPDGRLFALLRSHTGHPLWTQSRNHGVKWDPLRPLQKANGERFLHCCSPCPMYDWKGCEAGSGQYFALIHNTYDFAKKQQVRGPLYLIAGTFDPAGDQPIRFSEPRIFAPRKSGNSFYASYTVDRNGEGVLWFNDMKYWLLGRKIGAEWFALEGK